MPWGLDVRSWSEPDHLDRLAHGETRADHSRTGLKIFPNWLPERRFAEEWRHASGETAERIKQQLDAVDKEHWALAIHVCELSEDPAVKRIGEALKRLPE
jgi:hypothetical protein